MSPQTCEWVDRAAVYSSSLGIKPEGISLLQIFFLIKKVLKNSLSSLLFMDNSFSDQAFS